MIGLFRARFVAPVALLLSMLIAGPAAAAAAEASPGSEALSGLVSSPRETLLQPTASAPIVAQAPVVAAPAVSRVQRPLHDLVISFVNYGNQSEEELCLAKAVYFEARGETLEGQLAVAQVVLNRAASGVYPPSVCGVVTQHAQFSFVHGGRMPDPDANSYCWKTALAIADVAVKKLSPSVAANVLWYHATYVAPVWGRFHLKVAQIGTHIFYS